MKAKIGINGLGRIGRMVVRSIFEENHKNLKINHINNRADIRTACDLIIRDSIHGKFKAKISIEKKIQLNNTTKRFDILVHDIDGGCILLVECKAPNIKINQESFDQILRYNQVVNAEFLMVTNGIIHYYCRINNNQKNIEFLKEIPVNK